MFWGDSGLRNALRSVDWGNIRRDAHNLFTKLIRTRNPQDIEGTEIPAPGTQRLSRCLDTTDLTSLGVGSCAGTGMYLVSGMVVQKFAGPGASLSFMIAAIASIFSGFCYAEFGVRVPNTTGSAYTYSYVTIGEFIAFVIGWNMLLEYLIGTSACARALSVCFDSLCDGAITNFFASHIGTIFGKPPDFIAFAITILMSLILVAGVKKSLIFNNVLNIINCSVWVFIMTTGLFYVKWDNWSQHGGFLPYGWSGVFRGAATCFYAFIGFDIIATTGAEATNPKRSIPLAIVYSLGIVLVSYVTCSLMLSLVVPYDQVSTEAALLDMFTYVNAPNCKYIVAVGALAGLTVAMFGSMFPLPRVVYAMAQDGLIFKQLSVISRFGTPATAAVYGGGAASIVALFVHLEVLVEMMSIGTLLAYTLVSTCVLVLRYQPNSTNLIDLLPESFRTPVDPEGTASGQRQTAIMGPTQAQVLPCSQRVMVRRVTRSSPDSDDTLPGDESEEYGREDQYLIHSTSENQFYVPSAGCSDVSRFQRFFDDIYQRLFAMSYLCPGFLPWIDCGPATEQSGKFVIRAVGLMYILVIIFDMLAAFSSPGNFTAFLMVLLALGVLAILLMISRKPQNKNGLIYTTPGVPFVPAIAVTVNIYLILNLSILTLVRFTVWMILGFFMYFMYGIKNSVLETDPPKSPEPIPPPPNPLDRTMLVPGPTQSYPVGDRNIFQGDGSGPFGNNDHQIYEDPLQSWKITETQPTRNRTTSNVSFKQVETRFDPQTNNVTTHTSSRPPWAYPEVSYDAWDD
ncbi:unnamed protein product [Pieris brassicae]|uniref:Cationic amino acid transporter C-terminal domain-containing protein n=1 Tax=Pieris brassicae TaxID=7116 RepID=A0A9P0XKM2_PIEBR|nr:unnamed protein product [Pieris brassicae]